MLTLNLSNEHERYLVLSVTSNNKLSNDAFQSTSYDLEALIIISSYIVPSEEIEKYKKQALEESCHSLLFEQDLYNSFIGDYYWHPDVKLALYETNESYEYPCFYNYFKYYLPFSEYDFSRHDLEQTLNRSILTPSIIIANSLGLKLKSGSEVAWITNQGEPIFNYIADEKNGNAIAAIKRSILEHYLVEKGLSIVWYVFFQKNVTNTINNESIGELNYHGIYTLKNGSLNGDLEERDRYFHKD
jgi:hypothetical protein